MIGPAVLAVTQSCFILFQIGSGEVMRNPSSSCGMRVSPQSTFKVPHAIAALDAGVIPDERAVVKYDGHAVDFPVWGKDHDLASAMRYSVVWFFQEMARRLGAEREKKFLETFEYGNRDSSSGLTTFWLGGSLKISPEEQLAFLQKLYGGSLRASSRATGIVRRILVQPSGVVVNAQGEHPFARPWPADAVVSAKTGSGPTGDGRAVRWLVGHIQRGPKAWLFASNVVSDGDLPPTAAIAQAERGLIEAHVLR